MGDVCLLQSVDYSNQEINPSALALETVSSTGAEGCKITTRRPVVLRETLFIAPKAMMHPRDMRKNFCGSSSFSRESGEILFNLLSSKNDSGSIIVTSNLTVDNWIETFKDQFLTGAMVDRLTRMAHMIDMSGESYRLRQTREWMNKTNEK